MLNLRPLAIALLLVACGEEPPPDEAEPCPPAFGLTADGACVLEILDLGQLVAAIDAGTSDYLVPINREPFVQQHGPDKLRVVYGSRTAVVREGLPTELTAANVYRTIDPQDPQAILEQELPVGSLFVHHTPEGPPYGAMVKLEAGAAPEDNDWFFARFDDNGYPQPIESYDGGTCRDCHVLDDRPERTDMLWGVPRASL